MTDEEVSQEKDPVHKDWTQGSITKNLWSLAWPMTISSSLMLLGPFIDMIWIRKLGSEAMAAVIISGTVVMLINSVIMGLYTGLRALVARFVGAGENEKANHVAQQGLIVGILLSLGVAAIGYYLAGLALLVQIGAALSFVRRIADEKVPERVHPDWRKGGRSRKED